MLEQADRLFASAEFDRARDGYQALARADPRNAAARLRLGEIALLENRNEEAERSLLEALALDSSEEANRMLAEVYYRSRAFDRAASHLRRVGAVATARKLSFLSARGPYQVDGPELVRVKLVATDPLPLIAASVNGAEPVNFILDTGAPELIIDRQYAQELSIVEFGSSTGTFAGDRTAPVIQAAAESIGIGGFRVSHVPVHLLPTRRFSGLYPGRRVDGIVGTRFLYQFTATVDYPRGELELRRLGAAEAPLPSSRLAVPFWLAGDHYIIAAGEVSRHPMVLFVDTGLAGLAFAIPPSTLQGTPVAGAGQQVTALGGAGPVSAVRYRVDQLALGNVVAYQLEGVSGIFPPSLETKFGFRVGGLISHAFFRPYAVTFDFRRMLLRLS